MTMWDQAVGVTRKVKRRREGGNELGERIIVILSHLLIKILSNLSFP